MLQLLIKVLAAWRLTNLVVEDEITREMREYVAKNAHPKVAYLIGCKKCVSVWAGLLVTALPKRNSLALALSAGTILLNDQLDQQRARQFDRRFGNGNLQPQAGGRATGSRSSGGNPGSPS